MNCDQLFEVATSPPPCDDATRRQIDAHLAHCADCRRLVDAMSPALALFAEAEQVRTTGEPGSRGASLTAQLPAAEPSSGAGSSFSARPAVEDRARLRNALMSVAATLLAGMLLGGWLQRGEVPETAGPSTLEPTAVQTGEGFQVTPFCVERDANTSGARLVCCTSCHSADKTTRSATTAKVSLASLLASCQVCHEP